MNVDEFRSLLRTETVSEVVRKCIVNDDPGPYLTADDLNLVVTQSKMVFALEEHHPVSPIVVGSAKLGFSIVEKNDQNGLKPRYRDYRAGFSDIDIAIVSPMLYGRIWQDLAQYAANQNRFPWPNDLSPYMFHGWIRPDKFRHLDIQASEDWRRFMQILNTSPNFRHKGVSCALYHSRYFLELYQQRGVKNAKNAEDFF